MSEPFTLPTDAEEWAELGIDVTAPDAMLTAGDTDAIVDVCLRGMAALSIEMQRLYDAQDRSLALIRQSYAAKLEKVSARYTELEARACEIARTADFGGKKKSRALVYGEYGRRGSSETVKIVDTERAVSWCEANGYGHLVEITVVKKLRHSVAKAPLLLHIQTASEVPDGVEFVAAKDEPFAKPDVTVYAAEQGGGRA